MYALLLLLTATLLYSQIFEIWLLFWFSICVAMETADFYSFFGLVIWPIVLNSIYYKYRRRETFRPDRFFYFFLFFFQKLPSFRKLSAVQKSFNRTKNYKKIYFNSIFYFRIQMGRILSIW